MIAESPTLLDGIEHPYTDREVEDRSRQLIDIYKECGLDDGLSREVIEITKRSFWAHLALLVWTHDEKSHTWRIKPFAPLAAYKTLADFLDERQPDGKWAHPVFCADKSRQLMMSWFMVCRLDWIALHNPYSACHLISKTDEDGEVLLTRLASVHANYPRWYRDAMGIVAVRHLKGMVDYPNESLVESLAQKGGQAIRSRVPTAVAADEAAFQDSFEKNWTSIKGTCDDRSQLMAFSTAASSHFQLLIEDRLDGRRGGRSKTYHASTGLTIWRNKLNDVDCARLHYTSDPARRSEAWKRQAMRGMAMHQWRQEQEIDYHARGGKPIFRMLDREVHITAGHLEVLPAGKGEWSLRIEGFVDPSGQPIVRPVKLLRMVDHGTTNYCAAVWIAVDEDLDWFVYRTYRRSGWFAPENAAAIAAASINQANGQYETYAVDVLDAMQGLPDRRGKVEDIYRGYRDPHGKQPLLSMEAVKKGAGSRQEGLDLIAAMLHSTLAVCAPDHPYWDLEGYGQEHRQSFSAYSSLYLGADVAEELFMEFEAARWDEPKHGDPDLAQPETSLDMMDDLTDCVRYGIRAAAPRLLRQIRREDNAGAAA